MSIQRRKSKRSVESIRRTVVETTAKAWRLDEASTSPGGISGKSETRVRRIAASHPSKCPQATGQRFRARQASAEPVQSGGEQ
jgi:hypothetical protein